MDPVNNVELYCTARTALRCGILIGLYESGSLQLGIFAEALDWTKE